MNWLQLDSESVHRRVQESGASPEIPSLHTSLRRGVVGFTIVSLAGFAPWVFAGAWLYARIGEVGLYAVCAVVFVALSGVLMHRLILGPGSLPRFYALFSLSFTAYAVAWVAGWMMLKGHPGSVVGLLSGTILMGGMLAWAFGATADAPKVIVALFVLNALGYFVGGVAEQAIAGMESGALPGPMQLVIAKSTWGLCYGIGFGAGLGWAFHHLQAPTRARLLAGNTSAQG